VPSSHTISLCHAHTAHAYAHTSSVSVSFYASEYEWVCVCVCAERILSVKTFPDKLYRSQGCSMQWIFPKSYSVVITKGQFTSADLMCYMLCGVLHALWVAVDYPGIFPNCSEVSFICASSSVFRHTNNCAYVSMKEIKKAQCQRPTQQTLADNKIRTEDASTKFKSANELLPSRLTLR